ncbi:MAG TPA: O-antigen ligase family protein [Solirubrobacteraceae bacterium]|nr:O-antigen ligase family protein [Solirubrobacteraceae bacterium]
MGLTLTLLVAGVVGGTALLVALQWLRRTLRRPDGPERVVALLLVLLVLESALYANQSDVPTGVFHPQAGPVSFRIFDVLIPLALIALVSVRRRVSYVPGTAMIWTALLLWLAFAGVEGFIYGNPSDMISYHAKAILYLGAFALTASMPPGRWLESGAIRAAVAISSAVAAILMVTATAGLATTIHLPGLTVYGAGAMGADAATIFATLGIGTFAVALCRDEHRLRTVLVSLPLLAAPLVAGQRAAIVGEAIAVGVAIGLVPFALRRVRMTPSDVGLGLVAAVGLLALVLTVDALTTSSKVSLPLASQLTRTFESRGKQLSATERINQWDQARSMISARPVFGWGLGHEYDYYSPGFHSFLKTDLTHNIALDLWVRTGIVGLLLFLAAAIAAVRDAVVAWARGPDGSTGPIALICAAGLVGLLSKGMFESLFEKYRLTILIGCLAGMCVALAREVAVAAPQPSPSPAEPPARSLRLLPT